MISQQALQAFRIIYENEIGPAPDDKELVVLACSLMNLMNVTYRPVKKEWVEKLPLGIKIHGENAEVISLGENNNCSQEQK